MQCTYSPLKNRLRSLSLKPTNRRIFFSLSKFRPMELWFYDGQGETNVTSWRSYMCYNQIVNIIYDFEEKERKSLHLPIRFFKKDTYRIYTPIVYIHLEIEKTIGGREPFYAQRNDSSRKQYVFRKNGVNSTLVSVPTKVIQFCRRNWSPKTVSASWHFCCLILPTRLIVSYA